MSQRLQSDDTVVRCLHRCYGLQEIPESASARLMISARTVEHSHPARHRVPS